MKYILIIFFIAAGAFGGWFFFTKTPTISSSSVVVATSTPNTEIAPDSNMPKFSFPSLDSQYVFTLYEPANENFCIYRVVNNKGQEVNLKQVIDSYNIGCFIGEGFDSDFRGWINGDKFLLRDGSGKIEIIDVKNLTTEIRQYDPAQYYFLTASRSSLYWLFQKTEGGGDFTILDSNNQIVSSSLSYRYGMYDPINDGFVFLAGDQAITTISLRVDYFSLKDLKMRTLLKTDPINPFQRGCGDPSLSSKPGEIVIGPGCISVAPKYFSADGGIHIKL